VSNNCCIIKSCCYPKRNSDFLALISVLSPHFQKKSSKIRSTTRNSKHTVKPSIVQTFSSIKGYNALAITILLNGSEIWTIRKKMTSVEMKIFRTAGYTLLDHKRNEKFLE
jgi:hypothetical protein